MNCEWFSRGNDIRHSKMYSFNTYLLSTGWAILLLSHYVRWLISLDLARKDNFTTMSLNLVIYNPIPLFSLKVKFSKSSLCTLSPVHHCSFFFPLLHILSDTPHRSTGPPFILSETPFHSTLLMCPLLFWLWFSVCFADPIIACHSSPRTDFRLSFSPYPILTFFFFPSLPVLMASIKIYVLLTPTLFFLNQASLLRLRLYIYISIDKPT